MNEIEIITLKKRLSSFKSPAGQYRGVSDELSLDILRAWENWPGKSKDFYQQLGLSKQQLGSLIGKGKQLIKSGVITESEFKELKLEPSSSSSLSGGSFITMRWDKVHLIRFCDVDQLVDFLKKVA